MKRKYNIKKSLRRKDGNIFRHYPRSISSIRTILFRISPKIHSKISMKSKSKKRSKKKRRRSRS